MAPCSFFRLLVALRIRSVRANLDLARSCSALWIDLQYRQRVQEAQDMASKLLPGLSSLIYDTLTIGVVI